MNKLGIPYNAGESEARASGASVTSEPVLCDRGVPSASEGIRANTANWIKFCGVNFWNSDVSLLVDAVKESGGYVVVPAAPAFPMMQNDLHYREAVCDADYAIIDSGLMAIMMAILQRRPISRISGLQLLQHLLLYHPEQLIEGSTVLWVTPRLDESLRIQTFMSELASNRSGSIVNAFYEAPFYDDESSYRDETLRDRIAEVAPDMIVLCIGGGRQEKLAFELRHGLGVDVPIFCTGAAISFLTGSQAPISTWVDRCYLGWLSRIIHDPKTFLPRYFRAATEFPLAVASYYRGRW